MTGPTWDDTTAVTDRSELEAPAPEEGKSRAYLIVIAGSRVGEMYKVEDDVVIGRSGDASVKLLDEGISRQHCAVRLQGEEVVIQDLGSTNGTFCNGEKLSGSRPLADGDKVVIGKTTVLKFSYHDELDESFQHKIFESALRDPLTGAFNKRYLMDRLAEEVRFANRHKTPLSLLLLDLDYFKEVNDTYGHLAGDRVLAELGRFVGANVRTEDVFARYGGEEFVVFARGIAREGGILFAKRLRRGIEDLEVEYEGRRLPITASIGVASIPEDPAETPDDLIAAADRAVYEAKRRGRNCVVPESSG